MKRLSPAKRNQLILVLVVIIALIASVYLVLIGPQKDQNIKLLQQISDSQAKLSKYKTLIDETRATSNQLASVSEQLKNAEQDVAQGDAYAWIYETIRRFKVNYHLDIPTIGQPAIGNVDIIPNFPYKQIRLALNGTAYYHDLGKFVADFENQFPHMRLVNLSISSGGNGELLSFHVDVIALIKPNT